MVQTLGWWGPYDRCIDWRDYVLPGDPKRVIPSPNGAWYGPTGDILPLGESLLRASWDCRAAKAGLPSPAGRGGPQTLLTQVALEWPQACRLYDRGAALREAARLDNLPDPVQGYTAIQNATKGARTGVKSGHAAL